MSESSFSGESDIEEIADLEMFIQEFEDEQSLQQQEAGPSCHRRYVPREREVAEARLLANYFGDNPKYTDENFNRRFRMSRRLFLQIVQDIETYIETHHPLLKHFDFVRVQPDARGIMSFSVIMKCTCALRQLAYGVSTNALDEYLQICEQCAHDCLDFFTMCIIHLYVKEFLRKPDEDDIRNLYNAHNIVHKLPGMLGSIDCMHWEWKNCPKEWQGQFHRGDKKYPTIMLEAVASYDLWIWHAFFGVAGANNDLTVLKNSPLFDDLLDDIAHEVDFEVYGCKFKQGYYLADGIYPEWASFVKSFTVASNPKNMAFKAKQESARKDIERAFGVLQGCWHIIAQPPRAFTVGKLRRIMYSCIILHNMILKDQQFAISDIAETYISPTPNFQRTWIERCELQRKKTKELQDKRKHAKLQRCLIEHVWQQVQWEQFQQQNPNN